MDFQIGTLYLLLGLPEDAVREWLAFFARFEGPRQTRGTFQRGVEEGGWQEGMRALIRLMIPAATQGAFGLANLIAQFSAVIGETEQAMIWLERCYDEREPLLSQAKVDPVLDPLRSDPRFQDLLRRIGFPES